MTLLQPMRAEAYPAYVESSVLGYAEDNIANGRWPAEGAVERSRAEFLELLPQGLATPDHHLFEILAEPSGETVGHLWLAVELRNGLRGAFVYDVEILPAHRRQGHARRAFQALESVVAAFGLTTIGLHVFGQNAGAQALYAQLGYTVTGMNMLKSLGPAAVLGQNPGP